MFLYRVSNYKNSSYANYLFMISQPTRVQTQTFISLVHRHKSVKRIKILKNNLSLLFVK